MNTNRVFLGNIMCDKDLVCTTALLKCKNDSFVALDNVDNIIDIFKLNTNSSDIMTFSTDPSEYYYVDPYSLIPYYEKKEQKTLRKIKDDFLLDPRNPRGIDN